MEVSSILILLLLIILSAFFSSSETALIALSPAKVRNLRDQKKRFARFVVKLKEDPNKLLITILIGNNVVNILASVYATVVFSNAFESSAIGYITGFMTFFILVFGEVVPKTFANKYSASMSLLVSPILYILSKILSPIVYILNLIVRIIEKIITPNGSLQDELVSEDLLKAMVTLGAEKGHIEKDEEELIQNVLEFNDILVGEVMTPRIHVDALPCSTTIKEAGDYVLNHTHTRIPVYSKSLDNVLGIVTVKDILGRLNKGEFGVKLHELDLQKPALVPETKKINEMFKEFQKRRVHIAIVVDEYGGTSGIVTMEDLLEEIVGEIIDEHDKDIKEIVKIGNSEWEVVGNVEVHAVNEALKTKFPAPEHKPISFLILQELNEFPNEGEKIEVGGFIFTVEKMSKRRIEKLKIEKK